jgi:hypothetical protein
MAGDIQTPFSAPVCPTPGGSATGGVAHSGGIDLGDGTLKESANSSGLPGLPSTYNPGEGTPGDQITMPPVASPGTIPSKGAGN